MNTKKKNVGTQKTKGKKKFNRNKDNRLFLMGETLKRKYIQSINSQKTYLVFNGKSKNIKINFFFIFFLTKLCFKMYYYCWYDHYLALQMDQGK